MSRLIIRVPGNERRVHSKLRECTLYFATYMYSIYLYTVIFAHHIVILCKKMKTNYQKIQITLSNQRNGNIAQENISTKLISKARFEARQINRNFLQTYHLQCLNTFDLATKMLMPASLPFEFYKCVKNFIQLYPSIMSIS